MSLTMKDGLDEQNLVLGTPFLTVRATDNVAVTVTVSLSNQHAVIAKTPQDLDALIDRLTLARDALANYPA